MVDFLRRPERYKRPGARIPKGVLLAGPPGTGKTLLVRAVAGEAGVPFFYLSGSDFVELFVGLGAARVRELFEEATSKAPCLVFTDELDTIGTARGGAGPAAVGGHDEREQTLTQLLSEMDGFDSSGGVIIMAVTNAPRCSTRRCCNPAASTGRSPSTARTAAGAPRSSPYGATSPRSGWTSSTRRSIACRWASSAARA